MVSNTLRTRPDRRNTVSRQQLLSRVRAEFVEMPCLCLTRAQAQRLFGLRADICERVLAALVAERTLRVDADERYRFDDQADHRPTTSPSDKLDLYRSQAS